jgi:hypothetical protein
MSSLRASRAPRDDGGQILILVLGFVLGIGFLTLALVQLTATTAQGANNLEQLRAARTAGDHAVSALIRSVRYDTTGQGNAGNCTLTQGATEGGISVTASCSGQTTDVPGHRYVFFTATWGSITVVKAAVTFQDYTISSSGITPSIGAGEEVDQWSYAN